MWVSPHLLKFPIYFVRSGGQLCQVFDLRTLLSGTVFLWLGVPTLFFVTRLVLYVVKITSQNLLVFHDLK